MNERNNPGLAETPGRNTVLTPEQVRSLLNATNNQPEYRDLHDVVKLMLRSGIRSSELARLRWVDFMYGVRVMRVKSRKAGVTRGTIMDIETVALLEARRNRLGEAEFVMGNSPARAVVRVGGQFRRIAKTLGIPANGLHILRRTARRGATAHPTEEPDAIAS